MSRMTKDELYKIFREGPSDIGGSLLVLQNKILEGTFELPPESELGSEDTGWALVPTMVKFHGALFYPRTKKPELTIQEKRDYLLKTFGVATTDPFSDETISRMYDEVTE